MTGDSMYSGSPGADRYAGSDSRYNNRKQKIGYPNCDFPLQSTFNLFLNLS